MSAPDHVVGVDLGGTKISVAVVDGAGRVASKLKAPIQKEGTIRQIFDLTDAALGEAGIPWQQIAAVGVCVPGIYFAETGRAWAPNLWGWDQVPLRAELASALPVPVVIDSDRAAYVLGEQWLGAARGLTDVVFLAIGTGIGAGILIDGRLCRGAGGIAGAVGWFALDSRKKEIYRQTGCFEAEAAGPAMGRRAAARIAAGERSLIAGFAGDSKTITAETVVEAARRGDALARDVLDETAAYIAMGVANLVSALNPQMVVLGGGLMQAGDLLLEPVRREVLDWAQPLAARQVQIELTRLGEDAGVLGAARLALTGPAAKPTN